MKTSLNMAASLMMRLSLTALTTVFTLFTNPPKSAVPDTDWIIAKEYFLPTTGLESLVTILLQSINNFGNLSDHTGGNRGEHQVYSEHWMPWNSSMVLVKRARE